MNNCTPKLKLFLPIITVSEANLSEHWSKKYKRKKKQKLAIWYEWQSLKPNISLPCRIVITRFSQRKMDFDNLCSCLKTPVDVICDLILPGLLPGHADGDPRITIEYAQEKSRKKGIEVQIF